MLPVVCLSYADCLYSRNSVFTQTFLNLIWINDWEFRWKFPPPNIPDVVCTSAASGRLNTIPQICKYWKRISVRGWLHGKSIHEKNLCNDSDTVPYVMRQTCWDFDFAYLMQALLGPPGSMRYQGRRSHVCTYIHQYILPVFLQVLT